VHQQYAGRDASGWGQISSRGGARDAQGGPPADSGAPGDAAECDRLENMLRVQRAGRSSAGRARLLHAPETVSDLVDLWGRSSTCWRGAFAEDPLGGAGAEGQ